LKPCKLIIKLGSVLLRRWANYRSESEANVSFAEIDVSLRACSKVPLSALSYQGNFRPKAVVAVDLKFRTTRHQSGHLQHAAAFLLSNGGSADLSDLR